MTQGTKAITVPRYSLKAGVEDGLAEGEALAMVSLYGIKDHDGDRVKSGAFDDFAAEVNDTLVNLPMVWQHGRDPFDYIGDAVSLDAHAVDEKGREGLAVRVKFDIDSDIEEGRSRARQAYKNVKGRRVAQWSYAWEGDTNDLKDGSRELSNMRLSEVSPVLRGALSQTSTLAVKEVGTFEATWAGIAGMIQTDPELVTWLAAATGTDIAGIVAAIDSYVECDLAQESYEATMANDAVPAQEPGEDAYFKAGRVRIIRRKAASPPVKVLDPRLLAARAELELG